MCSIFDIKCSMFYVGGSTIRMHHARKNTRFIHNCFFSTMLNRAIAFFDDFHSAIGGWTSSGVDEEGDCRSEAVTTANRLVTSLDDKEEPAIVKACYLHSVKSYIVSILARASNSLSREYTQ